MKIITGISLMKIEQIKNVGTIDLNDDDDDYYYYYYYYGSYISSLLLTNNACATKGCAINCYH